MSGVEIAGLILGALPLVIHALERYSQGVQSVRRYLKYRRELESLVRRLGLEVEMFRNTCEELLNGIVPAEQIANMLDDPAGHAWHDPEIDKLLQKRLRRSYSMYLNTVRDMVEAVKEFKTRLKIDDMNKVPHEDPNAFKEMYKRVKFSLSRRDYEDLVKRIKDDNNYLKRLTSQNLRLEPARTAQRVQKSPNFEVIRDCAKSLFSTLQSGFACCCREPHSVNLLLEPRNDEYLDENKNKDEILLRLIFKVTFAYGYRNSVSNSSPWLWKPADVSFIDHPEENKATENSPTISSLKVKLTASDQNTNATRAKPQKVARFAISPQADIHTNLDTLSLSTPTTFEMTHIADLCNTMLHFWPPQYTKPFRGYLLDEAKRLKHVIYPTSCPTLNSISLGQAITGSESERTTPLKMSDKKYLAVTLASSLLQLCGTPWLGRQWKLDDIVFIYAPDSPIYPRPHISTPITSSKQPNPLEEKKSSNVSLVCPNIRNEFTFGLGILLIELCLGRTIEQLRIPSDLNPDGTEHVTTNFLTATRLLDDVYQEAGGRYGDAVRRCIYCEFDQRITSLEDPSFRRAVYEGVVYWLEEDWNQFHNLG